jgi:hypothetical protein
MWKFGTKLCSFISWYICFEFSVQCTALSKFSEDISKSFRTKMNSPEILKTIFYSFLKKNIMYARLYLQYRVYVYRLRIYLNNTSRGIATKLENLRIYIVYGGRVLDEIRTKILSVFLLAIHSHLYSFALRFLFFKLRQPHTVSTVQLHYSVKEKGGKPDRTSYLFPVV